MLHILTGAQLDAQKAEHDQLLRLRYDIFVGVRRWSVPSFDGRERDRYDCPAAFYFFDRDDTGHIGSHARITATTTHSLLADNFPHLVEPRFDARGQGIMECTRFLVIPPDRRRTTKRRLEAQLFEGITLWCLENGYSHLQAVLDTVLLPTFLELAPQSFTLGLAGPYGGGPTAPGGGSAIAVRCPMNQQTLAAIRDYGDLPPTTSSPTGACHAGFTIN